MTTDRLTRRHVLGAAALAGAAGSPAPAAPTEPLRIGVFGLDYTYWGIWADLLSPKGKWSGTSVLRMRPTHVWDKDQAKARKFAGQWGCEVVDRYDGMLGKVDGVVNGDLYNIPWQHLLLRPYIEAGLPCYLQRPWSNTLPNLDAMLDLAAKHGAPIIATATFEHYDVAASLAPRLSEIGEIQAVFGTAQVRDRPHFHLPYLLMRILGDDVAAVSMVTNDPRKVEYLAVNYVYPRTEKRPGFVAAMHAARPDVFRFTIQGERGSISAAMPAGASYFERFFTQLLDIQRTFERREHFQPLEAVRRKFRCVQSEYYSHFERGGALVRIADVPADWPIPPWSPGWYDGSEFSR